MFHRHQWSLEWPCLGSRAGLAQVLLESFQSDEKSPSLPQQQDGDCRRHPGALDAWADDTHQLLPSQGFPGLLQQEPVTPGGAAPQGCGCADTAVTLLCTSPEWHHLFDGHEVLVPVHLSTSAAESAQRGRWRKAGSSWAVSTSEMHSWLRQLCPSSMRINWDESLGWDRFSGLQSGVTGPAQIPVCLFGSHGKL